MVGLANKDGAGTFRISCVDMGADDALGKATAANVLDALPKRVNSFSDRKWPCIKAAHNVEVA